MSTNCKTPAQNPIAKGQFCQCNEIAVPGKGCQKCTGTVPNEKHTECVSCGRGFPNTDGQTCTMCGDDEYLNEGKCSKCGKGKYLNPYKTACSTCGKNEYVNSDSSGCATCPTGTYANEGSTECTVCGNVCSETDSTCPACGASTNTDESKLSESARAGIVIGSIAGVVILGLAGYLMYVRYSTPSQVNKVIVTNPMISAVEAAKAEAEAEYVAYDSPMARGQNAESWKTERSGSSRSNNSRRSGGGYMTPYSSDRSGSFNYHQFPGSINTP